MSLSGWLGGPHAPTARTDRMRKARRTQEQFRLDAEERGSAALCRLQRLPRHPHPRLYNWSGMSKIAVVFVLMKTPVTLRRQQPRSEET